jgi:predicted MFS family arabinose efflux permease
VVGSGRGFVQRTAGYFAFFTYIVPFLETLTGVGAAGMAGMFLAFGIADFLVLCSAA